MRATWEHNRPERRSGAGADWWRRVEIAYSEPHRRYHTLAHLGSMFGDASPYAPLPPALDWAIWFHDFIYDPRAGNNEEESARVAREALTEMQEQREVVDRTTKLILATKHGSAEMAGADAQLLISLDLKILAAPAPRYDAYVAQIREEFAHVPDELFRAGRGAFMRRFLERGAIFPHPDFHRFEGAARANIVREIDGLY